MYCSESSQHEQCCFLQLLSSFQEIPKVVGIMLMKSIEQLHQVTMDGKMCERKSFLFSDNESHNLTVSELLSPSHISTHLPQQGACHPDSHDFSNFSLNVSSSLDHASDWLTLLHVSTRFWSVQVQKEQNRTITHFR